MFEVDEAATRIREEVDEDANIILGATFDESLEGTIRVSVVATGIDNIAKSADNPQSESASSSLGSIAAASAIAPVSSILKTSAHGVDDYSTRPEIAQATASVATPVAPVESVEKDGVRIEPFKPQSSIFSDTAAEEEFKNALEEELMPKDDNFIPPSAQTIDQTFATASIPDVKDFPPIARREIEASETPAAPVDDRGPMGLLKKLKSGFGLGDDKQEIAAVEPKEPILVEPTVEIAAPVVAPIVHETSVPMGTASPVAPSASVAQSAPQEANPFAPSRAGLDQNGRIAAKPSGTSEEDQLDIPAFLRRQAN